MRNELGKVDASNTNYGAFEIAFDKVLNKHALLKKKYVRANDAPFMTKVLQNAYKKLNLTYKNIWTSIYLIWRACRNTLWDSASTIS